MMERGSVPKKYRCSLCGVRGWKLWRDYGHCDELWCAACCEKQIVEKGCKVSPWDEPPGPLDMMRLGFSGVPAIPTDEECDIYQSSGALKAEQLLWWHSLPTHFDADREIQTVVHTMRKAWDDLGDEYRQVERLHRKVSALVGGLGVARRELPPDPTAGGYGWEHKIDVARGVMLGFLEKLYGLQKLRMELWEDESHCEWLESRMVLRMIQPTKVTIYGSKTVKSGKYYITGPEEQPLELAVGQRIAVGRTGSAVVLLGERFRECPSVMDHGQDGIALAKRLIREKIAVIEQTGHHVVLE